MKSKTSMLRFEPKAYTRIKEVADAKGVKMATLMRMWILERLVKEYKKTKDGGENE